jgi:hypothetical protein
LQGEGVDSEEPFVFPSPGEEPTDEGDQAEAGGGEGGEDEDGGDEESLFGYGVAIILQHILTET